MADELPEISSLETICTLMRRNGVTSLAFKRLAPNDNSKNQPYLGGDYATLQLLPFDSVTADRSRKDAKRDRFKAKLSLFWMGDNGALFRAPNAQLVLYPKYPEVRLSGFLMGAQRAPSGYMTSRLEGRVLLLGITDDRRIIGHVVGPDNPVTRELDHFDGNFAEGVFSFVFRDEESEDTRRALLAKLHEIAEMGWVDSRKLDRDGNVVPYSAQNAGGLTLEALLGITPNARNEPDYLGWEIKQHKATRLDDPLSGGAVTLMTPQPTGGLYKSEGVIPFVHRFGYPDRNGVPDRLNFGGIHRYGDTASLTRLRLDLLGFDPLTRKIENIEGGIALLDPEDTIAALWGFETLLEMWNRKHAQAAYLGSHSRRTDAGLQYRYGHIVALGEDTDFTRFLNAIAVGDIYYDPGIKIEDVSTERPKPKVRSQFRIRPRNLASLYRSMEIVNTRRA